MSFFNWPVLLEQLRKIKNNPQMHGPNEVAKMCGVAADGIDQLLGKWKDAGDRCPQCGTGIASARPEVARIQGEITHRWSGPYHDRLEYLLNGRPLSMEEVKGMLKAVCVPSPLARSEEDKRPKFNEFGMAHTPDPE
jgi:hypothetical protein